MRGGGNRSRNRGQLAEESKAQVPPPPPPQQLSAPRLVRPSPFFDEEKMECDFSLVRHLGLEQLGEPRKDDICYKTWSRVYTEHWMSVAQSLKTPPTFTTIKPYKLYLSSVGPSRNVAMLRGSGIRSIIDIGSDNPPDNPFFLEEFNVLSIRSVPDSPTCQIIGCIRAVLRHLDESLCVTLEELACPAKDFRVAPAQLTSSPSDVSTDDDESPPHEAILIHCQLGRSRSTSCLVGLLLSASFQTLGPTAVSGDLATSTEYFEWLVRSRNSPSLPNPAFQAQVNLLSEVLAALVPFADQFPGPTHRDRRRAQLDYALLYLDAYYRTADRCLGESISHLSTAVLSAVDVASANVLTSVLSCPMDAWLTAASQVQCAMLYWDFHAAEMHTNVRSAHNRLVEDFRAEWAAALAEEGPPACRVFLRESQRVLLSSQQQPFVARLPNLQPQFPSQLFWSHTDPVQRQRLIIMCLGLAPFDAKEFGPSGHGPVGWSLSLLLNNSRTLVDKLVHISKLVAVSQAWSWNRWVHQEFRGLLTSLDAKLAIWADLRSQDFCTGLWNSLL